MAQILVRKIDDEVKLRLQQRARRNRRGLEAEARAILSEAAARECATEGFGTMMRRRFAKHGLTPEEAEAFNSAIESMRQNSKPRDPGFEP